MWCIQQLPHAELVYLGDLNCHNMQCSGLTPLRVTMLAEPRMILCSHVWTDLIGRPAYQDTSHASSKLDLMDVPRSNWVHGYGRRSFG